jgi:hypothetical protein
MRNRSRRSVERSSFHTVHVAPQRRVIVVQYTLVSRYLLENCQRSPAQLALSYHIRLWR